MCGRYALALRPSQVRAMLQDENMPVYDAPPDEGEDAPRQSYNFAPGYHGIVYRADVPDWGAGPARQHGAGKSTASKNNKTKRVESEEVEMEEEQPPTQTSSQEKEMHYILQSMKWGLIPFWTKRNPDYGSMLKTINCRDDSLASSGGMWTTMKARKRCLVVAQGFFEWLKPKHSKEKIPHYVKRKDGKLMFLAGLWDCVVYEDGEDKEKKYTYTIITTDSNPQLKFLHDRMPVIFEPGSEEVNVWLDPGRWEWDSKLQGLLKPFKGELEVYPVNKGVGKVGNNEASFVVPVGGRENKGNIANFFRVDGCGKPKGKGGEVKEEDERERKDVVVKKEDGEGGEEKTVAEIQDGEGGEEKMVDEIQDGADDGGMFKSSQSEKKGLKRERKMSPEIKDEGGVTPKKIKMENSSTASSPLQTKGQRPTISATRNMPKKSPMKSKGNKAVPAGSQKITKFFGNSA